MRNVVVFSFQDQAQLTIQSGQDRSCRFAAQFRTERVLEKIPQEIFSLEEEFD